MKKAFEQIRALNNGASVHELAYDDRIPPSEAQRRKRQGEKIRKLWQNPEYRAKMLAKQRALGYRTYPQ